MLKQPNLSARIGVKSLFGRHIEATNPVSQDLGEVVVGWCWRPFAKVSNQSGQPGLG